MTPGSSSLMREDVLAAIEKIRRSPLIQPPDAIHPDHYRFAQRLVGKENQPLTVTDYYLALGMAWEIAYGRREGPPQ